MNKIPLKEIDDEDEFWCGAIFRKEGTRLNIPEPTEDYYEYMLFLDRGMSDWMICAHIDKWEAGSVVSHVKMNRENNQLTIKAKDFKYSMILPEEIDSWFFIESGKRNTRIKK